MKYTGGGFIVGIPSRDLSPEEVAEFGENALLSSGLYKNDKVVIKKEKELTEAQNGERD